MLKRVSAASSRGNRGSSPEARSSEDAVSALSALGQPSRLAIFRLLMQHEPDGLAAGAIAEAIGCAQNTLSSHIGILVRTGLVRGTRAGRSIVYRADVEGMRTLIGYLVTDCCDGHPELCGFGGTQPKSGCGCS
jgi:ArsR family transcriptional regulator, arsenate/arsenite/antimonite-responsive transcriptional repressor